MGRPKNRWPFLVPLIHAPVWVPLLLLHLAPAASATLRDTVASAAAGQSLRSSSTGLGLASAADPRTAQRKAFTYGGGLVKSSTLNVALLFLGDGWKECSKVVLEDLVRSLDTSYFNSLPRFVARSDFLTRGVNVCLPTVRAWWEGSVPQYTRTVKGKKVKATKTINYYGSYSFSSSQLLSNGYRTVYQMAQAALGQIVSVVPQKNFPVPAPEAKSNTVLLVLVGHNVSSTFLANPVVTSYCAAGYYAGPKSDRGPFAGFYGGIVAFGPHAANYSSTCNPYPRYRYGMSYSNNCMQSDVLASHILTRLADLVTNPSQFLWAQQGGAYILGQRQTTGNAPAWTCKQALAKKLYNASGVSCSAGQVCDLRRMNQYQVSTLGSAGNFQTNAPRGSPELVALNSAGLWQAGQGKRLTVFNVVSGGYLHFVQSYRQLSTGTCFTYRWKAGSC